FEAADFMQQNDLQLAQETVDFASPVIDPFGEAVRLSTFRFVVLQKRAADFLAYASLELLAEMVPYAPGRQFGFCGHDALCSKDGDALARYPAFRMQQFLYFLPLPQGHGSLRPTFWLRLRIGSCFLPSPPALVVPCCSA